MLQTVIAETVVEKKLSHLSSFHVPFLVMVLELSEKVHFLQFCADLTYIHLNALVTHFQKMVLFIML